MSYLSNKAVFLRPLKAWHLNIAITMNDVDDVKTTGGKLAEDTIFHFVLVCLVCSFLYRNPILSSKSPTVIHYKVVYFKKLHRDRTTVVHKSP